MTARKCDKVTETEAIICCLWAVTNDGTSNGEQLKCNYIHTTMQTRSPLLSLSSPSRHTGSTQQENRNDGSPSLPRRECLERSSHNLTSHTSISNKTLLVCPITYSFRLDGRCTRTVRSGNVVHNSNRDKVARLHQ